MAEIVTMPKLGFDMAEGVLVRWAVAEGESVDKGELLAEIETDKATVELESPHSGVVHKHLVAEEAIVPINDPIVVIGQPDETFDLKALVGGVAQVGGEEVPFKEAATQEAQPPPVAAVPPPEAAQLPEGVQASPIARKMAREQGIDLSRIQGSGPRGRIVKKDIEAYQATAVPAASPTPTVAPAPAFAAAVPEDTPVPLTKLRQAIGRRMTESRQHIPHFYVTYEYHMGPVMALRKQVNATLADSGVKTTVNDYILKAAALCLREYPNLNAALGEGEVIHYGHVNMGVAVAVEGGLLTVVCQDADRKSIPQISTEVREKADRARASKVHPDDIQGSTFTVSNLGMFGADDFIAIINPPETAILAVGAAKQVPVVVDGELTVGWRMKATISADHRVTDGAEAAQFMQAMASYLEEPVRLIL